MGKERRAWERPKDVMKHFQPQESGESLSRSRIFVACQSRFGGCTRTTTSLLTTSLLTHCANGRFDQKTRFPRKEWWAQSITYVSCEDCGKDYIEETERSFKARFDKHKRPSSVNSEVSRHINQENPGHSVSLTGTRILGVEASRMVSTRGEGSNFYSCEQGWSSGRKLLS